MNTPNKAPLKRLAHLLIAATIAAAGIAAVTVPTHVNAELIATPLRGDTRLVQFRYYENHTFLVLTKPKAVTHIQFAADEVIQSIAAGDTSSWEITPTKNRRHLFVKPRFEDIETSMTVITDKRTYQFVLRSTSNGRKWYQRVSWVYDTEMVLDFEPALDETPPVALRITEERGARGSAPSTPHAQGPSGPADANGCATVGIRPEAMRFNYEISGNAPFRPQIVFDDGRFTYLRMPDGLQELPALFAVIDGNDFSLVNYTVSCDFIIVQRIMEEAVLKLGRAEVRVRQVQPQRRFFSQTEN